MTEAAVPVPFGDTPHTRCLFYRRVCDLPAHIDPPELGRITLRAERTWALVMPSALGYAVRADLKHCRDHEAGANSGPIIAHPQSRRWTFLTRPDLPDDTATFVEMFRLDISIVRARSTIALPSPTDRGEHFRRWIHLPHCPFRPSGLAVLESIRACAARTGWLLTPTSGPHR